VLRQAGTEVGLDARTSGTIGGVLTGSHVNKGDGLFVVVSGAPGSGKSTVAAGLADGLCLALLAKDTIKEVLAGLRPQWRILRVAAIGRSGSHDGMVDEPDLFDECWHLAEKARATFEGTLRKLATPTLYSVAADDAAYDGLGPLAVLDPDADHDDTDPEAGPAAAALDLHTGEWPLHFSTFLASAQRGPVSAPVLARYVVEHRAEVWWILGSGAYREDEPDPTEGLDDEAVQALDAAHQHQRVGRAALATYGCLLDFEKGRIRPVPGDERPPGLPAVTAEDLEALLEPHGLMPANGAIKPSEMTPEKKAKPRWRLGDIVDDTMTNKVDRLAEEFMSRASRLPKPPSTQWGQSGAQRARRQSAPDHHVRSGPPGAGGVRKGERHTSPLGKRQVDITSILGILQCTQVYHSAAPGPASQLLLAVATLCCSPPSRAPPGSDLVRPRNELVAAPPANDGG
jgi:hypothetical protein